MTHFPKVLMGYESPLMRGYQHQLKRDSAEPLICADRDALGLDEREESGPTPVGSAARRITAKLSLVQSIVKGEQRERQKRGQQRIPQV